jgi:hypothetical protein
MIQENSPEKQLSVGLANDQATKAFEGQHIVEA